MRQAGGARSAGRASAPASGYQKRPPLQSTLTALSAADDALEACRPSDPPNSHIIGSEAPRLHAAERTTELSFALSLRSVTSPHVRWRQ